MSSSPGPAAVRGRIAGPFLFQPRHYSLDFPNQHLLVQDQNNDQYNAFDDSLLENQQVQRKKMVIRLSFHTAFFGVENKDIHKNTYI